MNVRSSIRTTLVITALLALAISFVPSATVLAQTAPPTSKPAVVTNPDLVPVCGGDIILVLDETGSIQTSGAEPQVREAAASFLLALADTVPLSEVAIAEFGSAAKTVFGYTEVISGTTGTLDTVFGPYLLATAPPPADVYDAPSQLGRYTNWDDALDEVEAINATKVAPLVVYVTDGAPTAYNLDYAGEPGGFITEVDTGYVGDQALWRAMEEANVVKTLGSKILVIGIGTGLTSAQNQQRMQDISGPQVWTGAPDAFNIVTDDVVLVPDLADLAAALQAIGEIVCNPLSVDLSYFLAESAGDVVNFNWETAMETRNAGFNLHVKTAGGQEQINDALISSSNAAGESLVTTAYSYSAAVEGDTFFIEMVSTEGGSESFGPYALGEPAGVPAAVDMAPSVWIPFIVQ